MEAMKKHLLNEADNCRHAAKMLRLDAETRRAVAQASAESATEYETKANEFERLAGLYPVTQERFNEKMDALDKANPEPLRQLMAADFHDGAATPVGSAHVGGYAYGTPRDDGSLSELM